MAVDGSLQLVNCSLSSIWRVVSISAFPTCFLKQFQERHLQIEVCSFSLENSSPTMPTITSRYWKRILVGTIPDHQFLIYEKISTSD